MVGLDILGYRRKLSRRWGNAGVDLRPIVPTTTNREEFS